MSIILSGGEAATGKATNNTKTDSFLVRGSNNDISTPGGGNLVVTGATTDTATTVAIGGLNNPAADQFSDTITIALNGSDNKILSVSPARPSGGGQLNDATVNLTISGTGGSNLVFLNNNGGGITTLSVGGAGNRVILSGDSTNTVTLGGATAFVAIGNIGDEYLGFNSTVQLSGGGNVVQAGDENVTITGGVAGNTVRLGNGKNAVTFAGGSNSITVGDGSNTISVGRANNVVNVGSGTNVISASGSNETVSITSGDQPSTGPGADSILLGGTGDVVTERFQGSGSPANISAFGSTGSATITLGNGNDSISAGGNGNKISLGSGSNVVVADGNDNTITVGAGSNTIFDTGAFSDVTLNGGAHSQDSTTIGNSDDVIATKGVQVVSAMDSDTISLSDTNLGSAITFGGTDTAAMIFDDGDVAAKFSATGTGNTLTINADPLGDYTGHAVIDGLTPGHGSLSFNGLAGLNTPQQDLTAFLGHSVHGGYEITTPGGGTVMLHATTLSLSMFG